MTYDISSDRLSDFLVEIVDTIDPLRTGYNGSSSSYGTHMNVSGILEDGSPFRVMMHPFCWCDMEDCAWCAGTVEDDEFDTPEDKDAFITKLKANDYVEGDGAPNFLLDINGKTVKIWWYKYIGRGMTSNVDFDEDLIDRFISKMRSLMAEQRATFAAASLHEHLHNAVLGLEEDGRKVLVAALQNHIKSCDDLDATLVSLNSLISGVQRADWSVTEVGRVTKVLDDAGVPDRCEEDKDLPDELVLTFAPHARLYPLLKKDA